MYTITATTLRLSLAVRQAIDETDVVSRDRAVAQLEEAIAEEGSVSVRDCYKRARNRIGALAADTLIDVTR